MCSFNVSKIQCLFIHGFHGIAVNPEDFCDLRWQGLSSAVAKRAVRRQRAPVESPLIEFSSDATDLETVPDRTGCRLSLKAVLHPTLDATCSALPTN